MSRTSAAKQPLQVWLLAQHVGELSRNNGQLIFQYAPTWLAQPTATSLSYSLPLRTQPFVDGPVKSFFAGLLPEGQLRQMISQQLQVSAQNEFALLDQIGGECAGAVSLRKRGDDPAPPAHTAVAPQWLAQEELLKILEELPRRPMLAGKDGLRLSLAGAQDKLPVIAQWSKADGLRIALPYGNAPSTHILKPAIEGLEGSIANEAFCLALARSMALPTAQAQMGSVGSGAAAKHFLLVQRYDRTGELKRRANAKVQRLHQEDFCQALGLMPEFKYQNEGGPDVAQCFVLLREITRPSAPHVLRLLDAVIFNTLLGNHDAHAKNFSVFYAPHATFTPLYDLLCTAVYPHLSAKMAMKIGSQYQFSYLKASHWDALAAQAGLSPAQTRRRVGQLARQMPLAAAQLAQAPEFAGHAIVSKLVALLTKRCVRMQQVLA